MENPHHQLALRANPPEGKKIPKKRSRIDRAIEKEISSQTFIVSALVLLIGGLIFLGGFYYILNKDFREEFVEKYLPVTTKPASFNLQLTNPDDELLTYDKSLVVSGKTAPKSSIIISNLASGVEDQDKGVETNFQGSFSEVIDLIPGVNQIEVTAFDSDGNTDKESVTVYYSEDKIQ